MDIDTRKHFEKCYNAVTFSPPQEVNFFIYSAAIWRYFLNLLPDRGNKIIDFGCGRGTCLFCLEQLGYRNLFGMDFCNSIPDGFLQYTKFTKGDVVESNLKADDFDGLISTMVIEHVDESMFVDEVYRILKKGGVALITSVLKGRFSWYFYRNREGQCVVEPTHVKEYRSIDEYKSLFKDKFDIIYIAKPRLAYSCLDPLFRAIFNITRWNFLQTTLVKNLFLNKIRKIRLPIPGYYSIEILVRKR